MYAMNPRPRKEKKKKEEKRERNEGPSKLIKSVRD
jgi:hypothetical protein